MHAANNLYALPVMPTVSLRSFTEDGSEPLTASAVITNGIRLTIILTLILNPTVTQMFTNSNAISLAISISANRLLSQVAGNTV